MLLNFSVRKFKRPSLIRKTKNPLKFYQKIKKSKIPWEFKNIGIIKCVPEVRTLDFQIQKSGNSDESEEQRINNEDDIINQNNSRSQSKYFHPMRFIKTPNFSYQKHIRPSNEELIQQNNLNQEILKNNQWIPVKNNQRYQRKILKANTHSIKNINNEVKINFGINHKN